MCTKSHLLHHCKRREEDERSVQDCVDKPGYFKIGVLPQLPFLILKMVHDDDHGRRERKYPENV